MVTGAAWERLSASLKEGVSVPVKPLGSRVVSRAPKPCNNARHVANG